MNNARKFCRGKKTYLIGTVICLTVFCSWQGWIKVPNEAYVILVGLAFMFLRSGISREIRENGNPQSIRLEPKFSAELSPRLETIKSDPRNDGNGHQAGGVRMDMIVALATTCVLGAVIVIFAWLSAGCVSESTVTPVKQADGSTILQTNTVRTLDTNAVITGINGVVPGAVRLACAKDANARPYFQQAQVLLTALADSGVVDPNVIQASLSNISIRELRSDEAIIAEQAALALYDAFAAQVVNQRLDRVTWLRPVLAAVANAIGRGLNDASASLRFDEIGREAYGRALLRVYDEITVKMDKASPTQMEELKAQRRHLGNAIENAMAMKSGQ
jgi:hypothetical protein